MDMLDVYKQHRKPRDPYDEAWALRLMRQAQEKERLSPMTPEEEAKEEDELNRYAETQTKKVGIKERDIPRLIESARVRRRKDAGSTR